MKTGIFGFLMCILLTNSVNAQSITASVSRDTLLAGNTLTLTLKAENFNGEIEKPELIGLEYAGGISQSSSMQIINGDVTKTSEYRYTIMADEVGTQIIGPAYAVDEQIDLETEAINIEVLSNPDGIVEPDTGAKSGNQMFFEWDSSVRDYPKTKPKEHKKINKRIRRI